MRNYITVAFFRIAKYKIIARELGFMWFNGIISQGVPQSLSKLSNYIYKSRCSIQLQMG